MVKRYCMLISIPNLVKNKNKNPSGFPSGFFYKRAKYLRFRQRWVLKWVPFHALPLQSSDTPSTSTPQRTHGSSLKNKSKRLKGPSGRPKGTKQSKKCLTSLWDVGILTTARHSFLALFRANKVTALVLTAQHHFLLKKGFIWSTATPNKPWKSLGNSAQKQKNASG